MIDPTLVKDCLSAMLRYGTPSAPTPEEIATLQRAAAQALRERPPMVAHKEHP